MHDMTTTPSRLSRLGWGWAPILFLSAVCIGAPSFQPGPNDWINGVWSGTLRIVSEQPDRPLSISAPLSMYTDRKAGVFDHLEGHGRLTLPHGPIDITFYDIDGVKDVSSSSRSYQHAGRQTFQLKARADSDFKLDGPSPVLNALDKDYCGEIGENAIHLQVCRCGAADYGMACNEPYSVGIDLERSPPRNGRDHLLDLIKYHGFLFIWLAPVFIMLFRRHYKPWADLALTIFFVLISPLTLWITWLVALATAVAAPTIRRSRNSKVSP